MTWRKLIEEITEIANHEGINLDLDKEILVVFVPKSSDNVSVFPVEYVDELGIVIHEKERRAT